MYKVSPTLIYRLIIWEEQIIVGFVIGDVVGFIVGFVVGFVIGFVVGFVVVDTNYK